MSVHIGLCDGRVTRDECEDLLERAVTLAGGLTDEGGPVELACTHVGRGRWAVSLRTSTWLPDDAADVLGASVWPGVSRREWGEVARAAALQLAAGMAGRVVRFPGQHRLTGTVSASTVGEVLDAVDGIAGTPTAGVDLVTRDFVRPELRDGRLVLTVRPWGADGAVAPFEVPDPVACCSVHR